MTELRATLRADFDRNPLWLPRVTLTVFRIGQSVMTMRGLGGKIARRLWRVADLVWTQLLIGAELPPTVACGPGLTLQHAGRGVILHPRTRLGRDVTLYHRVTCGVRGTVDGAPSIGDDVYLGTGATVIGAVSIGAGARVGAGAVVIRDVPSGATATGVPATIR